MSAWLLLLLCLQVGARIQRPCDLAQTMMQLGEKRARAGHWVCLAKYCSGFNSQALGGPHPDGSHDFGIFQINDRYCRLGTKEGCGVPCTDLVSNDVTPSAKCALKIFQKSGFAAWPAWKNNCQTQDTSRFVAKCSLKAPDLREDDLPSGTSIPEKSNASTAADLTRLGTVL